MGTAELTKMLELSNDAILYSLSRVITKIKMDELYKALDNCKQDGTIEYLNYLSPDGQNNVLSNEIFYHVFKQLCGEIDNNKLGILFEDLKNIDVLQDCDIQEIVNLSKMDKISSVYWHIYLKDLKNESAEILDLILAGFDSICSNLKDVDDDWLISMKEIAKLPFIISDKFINHENYKETLELLASRPDVVELLSYIYSVNDTAYISVSNFNQICVETESIFKLLKEDCSFMSIGRRYDFITVWLENGQLLYDLKCIRKKIDDKTDYSFTNDIVRYVSFCYGEILDMDVEQYQNKIMIYAISHKKKAFIKLVKENMEVFRSIHMESVLYNSTFYEKCINLNTLNVNNLKELAQMIYRDTKDWILQDAANRNFTFAEFRELYKVNKKIYDIYTKLECKSVDDRLIILKELESHSGIIKESDAEILPAFLNTKKLSDWYSKDFGYITDLDYKTLLQIFHSYPENMILLKDVDSCLEAKRICNNYSLYKDMSSLQEVRESILKTDKDWLELKVLLGLPDEFVQDNKESIQKFVINNGASILYSYIKKRKSDIENIKRLFMAEILNKFDELKYHNGDLSKELNVDIADKVQNKWQVNYKVCNSKFSIWEEDRLLPVMQIGETPTHTCLSYINGAYNECLLSNFDSNKKIIFAAKNNQIVFRAVLRLTKGTAKVSHKKQLEFYDVTGKHKSVLNKERILIFLERPYTSGINDSELSEIFSLVFEMLQQKAKDMGAILVCSNSYKSIQNSLITFMYNIYISKSKIGRQYLDSLGGSATSSDECKYVRTEILVDSNSLKLLS